jgi:integrase/recombinase XerD
MIDRIVESYLQIRRATGFGLKLVEPLLRSFARFAGQRHEACIVAKTAIEWARQTPSPLERDRRLKTVIRFARYARAENERHEIPPDGVFGKQRQRRRVPFIFSGSEIATLMDRAARHRLLNTLVPHTYSTLFGLLAATGLRVSEAFNLRMDDITPDGLLIRATKFRKNRLVPFHDTTAAALDRYIARRRLFASDENYLFVSLRGNRLCYQSVCKIFHSLLCAAGIQREPHLPQPRIHSLRHTFAVRSLENCPVDRDRITQHMLALSTYMGHSSLESTFWYLDATPQLLSGIARAWESFVWGGEQ